MSVVAQGFGSTFISQLLGIPLSRLHYWDKTGVVKPSIRPARGRGSRRLYSYEDLVALEVVLQLRESGLPLQRVRRAVRFLRQHHPELEHPLAELTFLTDGESIFMITPDKGQVLDVLSQHFVLSVPLGRIARRVQQQIEEATRARVETVHVGGRTFTVRIERDPETDWYIAVCEEIPGCATQGSTLEEAREMVRDAIAESLVALAEAPRHAKAKTLAR
ncbi:MAG: MerR family transcriptional regulator [Candidatus Korarchaeota archaeon]|nr:MerR family transcriptional regulator [Candidatus Korarchaeota archaeon]